MAVTQQQLADTLLCAEYHPRVLPGAHSWEEVAMWIESPVDRGQEAYVCQW